MARDEAAMTSERLAEWRARFAEPHNTFDVDKWESIAIIRSLLAEVERQRAALDAKEAREAALLAEHEQAMEIVRAVADQDCAQDIDDPEWMQCLACGGGGPTGDSIEHHEICYYVKARALLASADSEGSSGDGA